METAPELDGEALRLARERAGLSQTQLARAIGVADGQRVSRWERGEARPRSAGQLATLASALGVTPRQLLATPTGDPPLRWFRFAVGLSVDDLAKAVHVSSATVKRWEAEGLAAPSVALVRAVSEALSAPPADVERALGAR